MLDDLKRAEADALEELAAVPAMPEIDADDLARRIGLIWLQMALVSRRFPLEADVIELPDGRLAVVGGRFASLPDASRVRRRPTPRD